MSNSTGKLIIFEGIDHVGKSTISNLVFKKLRELGIDCDLYQYPGKAERTLGKLVYDIHHQQLSDIGYPLDPLSIQLLHVAAHIDLLNNKIIPAISNSKLVLLDRYWWSTVAYGIGDNIKKENLFKLIELEKEITNSIKNKTYFYITRNNCDKDFTKEKEYAILCEYKELFESTSDGEKFVVENNRDLNTVTSEIIRKLKIEI